MKLNKDRSFVDESVRRFLQSSKLCDHDNDLVRQTAADLIQEARTPQEAAVKIYYFVRDDIKHEWVPMGQGASATLRSRAGDCWPKSILQVALLRAAGIPARYRWLEYRKHLFAGLVPTAVYKGLADPFPFHVLAEAYLGNRWIKADATFDRILRPDRAMDWDGSTDLIALRPDEITRDLGFTTSFEERLPQIEEFFGGSSGDDGADAEDAVDAESILVNLHFDLIRLKNRFDQASEMLLSDR